MGLTFWERLAKTTQCCVLYETNGVNVSSCSNSSDFWKHIEKELSVERALLRGHQGKGPCFAPASEGWIRCVFPITLFFNFIQVQLCKKWYSHPLVFTGGLVQDPKYLPKSVDAQSFKADRPRFLALCFLALCRHCVVFFFFFTNLS